MSRGPAVRFFQALGDETRLDLLATLREGERTVGELVDVLHCPQPKVSRHLKVLREAGLVTDRRDGRHVTYALTTPRMWSRAAREWLELLDAGFPLGAGGERRPAAARTGRAPSGGPRTAPERETARPEPARNEPARNEPAAEEPRPVRRPRMETHLL